MKIACNFAIVILQLLYHAMKRVLSFIFLLLFSLQVIADNRQEVIILHSKGGLRSGQPLYYDMPAAYYEYSPKGQRIIIDGGGAVSYYDVEISSATTGAVEMTTTVSGTYDTFNISSLSAGTHVITIESPSGNTFEGTCFYKS